ncbi:hypothetical protein CWB41_14045 [Methylovirgula ligni]|uniref:Putative tail protein n=1 Tax=Methylovirgula ligni TaxID=569860 RepID=A0A3D9YL17_9HYPH|nr:phage tail protein [Methylovirgula ligni]QAY96715.1 hypothetical protein CWB41_14045 [Methylovirgula ligni]REF83245.1 putative tail protein [Methylovirgula ligni]
MSFLRANANQGAQPTIYSGLQVQSSSSAVPITIGWGIMKVAPNFAWCGDLGTYQASGGGKGGATSGGTTGYTCAVICGMCEGPIQDLRAVWKNQTVHVHLSGAFPNSVLFDGELNQEPWSYLAAHHPDQILNYPGLAYVAHPDMNMGTAAEPPAISFEVIFSSWSTGANGQDADPAFIFNDFLTNPQYGVGFPLASIDSSTLFGSDGDASLQTYCFAAGICLSPVLIDQESASSILTRLLQLTNCEVIWSGDQLKFIPYGDTSITGALYSGGDVTFPYQSDTNQYSFNVAAKTQIGTRTFNPNIEPVYSLNDDDFVVGDASSNSGGGAKQVSDDPVQVLRTDPYELGNYTFIEIYQRTNYYDATPIPVFDEYFIETYGLRVGDTVTAHEICDETVGQTVGQLILQRQLYIRNTYKFTLDWGFCLLEPMDVVLITDVAIGLVNFPVRIAEIDEDDDGLLAITAEEFPGGTATSVAYPVQTKSSSTFGSNVPASALNAPIIFEPPYQLAGAQSPLQVYCAVSGNDPLTFGGYNVWVSTDGQTYTQAETVFGAATQGVTTARLAAAATGIDNVNTLSVDLSDMGGAINPASASDMSSGNSACYVGGEIIAYQNATLTSADIYALQPLNRGLFGSSPVVHATGTPFALLDGNIFKYPFQPSQIGQTVYFKFQPFNVLGGGVPDLSDCGAYPYIVQGSALGGPLATPQNLRLNFKAQFCDLTFDEVSDPRGQVKYYVLRGPSAQTAQQLVDVAHPPVTLISPDTYWVQSYIVPVPGLTVKSPISSGITLAANMLVTNELDVFDEQTGNWGGLLQNCSIAGTSPDEILQLNPVCNVDFGSVADTTLSLIDDFGGLTDVIVVPLDLGTLV